MGLSPARKETLERTEAEATSLTEVLYQEKSLTADINNPSLAAISDLTFNNLTVGQKYRAMGALTGGSEASPSSGDHHLVVDVTHDSAILQRLRVRGNAITDIFSTIPILAVFTATASTLTFVVSTSTNARILGTPKTTFVILEKLPNHTATTIWT